MINLLSDDLSGDLAFNKILLNLGALGGFVKKKLMSG